MVNIEFEIRLGQKKNEILIITSLRNIDRLLMGSHFYQQHYTRHIYVLFSLKFILNVIFSNKSLIFRHTRRTKKNYGGIFQNIVLYLAI